MFKDDKGTLKDSRIPILAGSLDHVESNEKRVYFFDIGVNRSGNIADNSFDIEKKRQQKKIGAISTLTPGENSQK